MFLIWPSSSHITSSSELYIYLIRLIKQKLIRNRRLNGDSSQTASKLFNYFFQKFYKMIQLIIMKLLFFP